MILVGLIAIIWIALSLLGIALGRAAGVADRQQQKTSYARRAEPFVHRLAILHARMRTCVSAIWLLSSKPRAAAMPHRSSV